MIKFKQYIEEERKTVRSHPYYVHSPTSYASYRKIGRFKSEAEAKAHVNQIQKHMPDNPLKVGKGQYPK